MSHTRFGTVGFSYRDWLGIFYPEHAPLKRQLSIYTQNFNVCELTQFASQMPEKYRIEHFVQSLRTDTKFYVRLHNTITYCADFSHSLTIAKHFRKAFEPLIHSGHFAGFVASFPYAFRDTPQNRDYVLQLSIALKQKEEPLQLDFRHPGWATESAWSWMRSSNLGYVCVDEPELPGLIPSFSIATTPKVLVRMHGRNKENWWSGNATTRHNYNYSEQELREMVSRYSVLRMNAQDVSFVFQNYWQANAVQNARNLKALFDASTRIQNPVRLVVPELLHSRRSQQVTDDYLLEEEDLSRPPRPVSLEEAKARVSMAFTSVQTALNLPIKI